MREVSVLPLPDGRDPADLAADGVEAVEAALHGTKTAVEFQIEHLLRGADTVHAGGSDRRLPRGPSRCCAGCRTGCCATATSATSSRPPCTCPPTASKRSSTRSVGADARRGATPPRRHRGDAPPAPRESRPANPRDPQLILEREVLRTALQHHRPAARRWKLVTAEDFRAPLSRTLFAAMADVPPDDLAAVLAALPDDDMRVACPRAGDVGVAGRARRRPRRQSSIARLRAAAVEREIAALRDEMARLGEQLDRRGTPRAT